MAANLGQKSTVVDGLVLCLDTTNPSSAPTTAQLVDSGFSTVEDGPDDSNGWQGVVFGSEYFVAFTSLGTNRLGYSRDGINWTSQTAVQANWWYGMAYGNGKFVCIARGGAGSNAGDQIVQYASESDLTSWTGVTPPEDNNFNGIAYGNGKFVAVSSDGTNRVMYASDSNLGSWSTASAVVASEWWAIAHGNGKFVAVSKDGSDPRIMYCADTDVTSWTGANVGTSYFRKDWRDVTFGDGYFVAVGGDDNEIAYSTDGNNWTRVDVSSLGTEQVWRRITFGDGYFVAVSTTNNASGGTASNAVMWAKSSDLSTWTLTNVPEQGIYNGIAYGRGRFVACSYTESTNFFFFADINHTNKWNDISLSKVGSTLLDDPLFSISDPSYIELNVGGGSQYYNMTVDYLSEFNFAALNYSIELWINRYDGYYVMDQRLASGSDNSYLTFSSSHSNRLVWRAYAGSVLFGDDADNPTATDGTWTGWRHYVITKEGTGSNECKLYYNGSFIATGTDASTHDTPGYFKIGVRSYDNGSPFKGRIGLFKVYKGKALSATEVLQSYNNTKERYN